MQLSKLEAWLEVLAWNEAHPVGSPVRYDSYIRRLAVRVYRTRAAAAVLPGNVAGVWITGHPCAVRLDRLQLAAEADAPAIANPLLDGTNAFRLLLAKQPGVTHYGLPFHVVNRLGFNPHAPDFPVLLLHVGERKDYHFPVIQPEAIEQGSHVLCCHNTLDVAIVLDLHAERCRQVFRCSELP